MTASAPKVVVSIDHKERLHQGVVASWVGIIVNLVLTALKLAAGIVGRSQAMIADAVESLSDVFSTAIVLFSLRISNQPVDWDHPYGHGRAETIATAFMSLIIAAAGLLIMWQTAIRVAAGVTTVPSPLALGAAVVVIGVKEVLYRYFTTRGHRLNSSALLATAVDQRKDAITTVAALVGIAGAQLGFPLLDPAAAVVVSLFILKLAYDIATKAGSELMDRVPGTDLIESIRRLALEVPGAREADVRARRLGPSVIADVKIEVDPEITVKKGHAIAKQVKAHVIDRIDAVADVMVHINPGE